MCAETLVASVDEARTLDELDQLWMSVYRPTSPGQLAALRRCTYYELQFTRILSSEAAAIDDQINEAPITWERHQQAQVAAHAATLADDSESAVNALSDTAAGCRWLIEAWSELKATLDADGCWYATSQRDRATRLLKCRPEDTSDEMVFWLSLMNLAAREDPDPTALAWYMEGGNMPDTLRRVLRDGPPDRAFCVDYLRRRVDEELAILKGREAFLRIQVEDPARANASKRKQVLEGEEGARILGYLRANDTAFHRNYKQLLKGDEGVVEVKKAEVVATCDEEKAQAAAVIEEAKRKVAAYNAEAALARATPPEIAPGNEATVPSEGAPADPVPAEVTSGNEANVPDPVAPDTVSCPSERPVPRKVPVDARVSTAVVPGRSAQAHCPDRPWLNTAEFQSSAEWDPEVSAIAALQKSLAIQEAKRMTDPVAIAVKSVSSSGDAGGAQDRGAGLLLGGGGADHRRPISARTVNLAALDRLFDNLANV